MARDNFEPIGKQARWRTIYDLLKPLKYDDILTYEKIGDALGLDSKRERHLIHANMQRAARELSEQHDRSISVVRGDGYRIVNPEEHVDLSRRDQRRSSRALVKAKRHVDHVNLSDMSSEGRSIVHATVRLFNFQMEAMRRLDVRQKNVEALARTVEQKGEETAQETAKNSDQLSRLEARLRELEESRAEVPEQRGGTMENKSVA